MTISLNLVEIDLQTISFKIVYLLFQLLKYNLSIKLMTTTIKYNKFIFVHNIICNQNIPNPRFPFRRKEISVMISPPKLNPSLPHLTSTTMFGNYGRSNWKSLRWRVFLRKWDKYSQKSLISGRLRAYNLGFLTSIATQPSSSFLSLNQW